MLGLPRRASSLPFFLLALAFAAPLSALALGKRPTPGIPLSEIGVAFSSLRDLDSQSLSSGEWTLRARIELHGAVSTYHPQGVKVLGDSVYVTSVEGKRQGRGHLLRYRIEGIESARLTGHLVLGTFPNLPTSFNHAGGLDGNAEALYIPLAEYRKKGRSSIVQVDLASFSWKTLGDLSFHAGALAYDESFVSFRVVGWGGGFTTLPLQGPGSLSDATVETRERVPTGPWQYQDCKSIGDGEAICSAKKGTLLPIGEIHLVRFGEGIPFEILHRIRVPKLKSNGNRGGRRPLSYNGMDVVPVLENATSDSSKTRIKALQFFFLPHDGRQSRLFVFEARVNGGSHASRKHNPTLLGGSPHEPL